MVRYQAHHQLNIHERGREGVRGERVFLSPITLPASSMTGMAAILRSARTTEGKVIGDVRHRQKGYRKG